MLIPLSFETCVERLSRPFNIFLGSMVSWDIAPGVWEARLVIFESIAKALSDQPAREFHWIGAYLATLVKDIRGNTASASLVAGVESWKFEELMAAFPNRLNPAALISHLYQLDPGIFNTNHLAVARLSSLPHCGMVVTTNFDTGIENALDALGVSYSVFTLDEYLANGDEPSTGVVVLKLHGCARKGKLAFRSRDLMSLEIQESCAQLRELLSAGTTFYFGYSGKGDVDVMPHLPTETAVWTNLQRNFDQSPFGATASVAACDLRQATSPQNLLICLASTIALTPHAPAHVDVVPFAQRVQDWLLGLDITGLVEFTQRILFRIDPRIAMATHTCLEWYSNRTRGEQAYWYQDLRDPPFLSIPFNRRCITYLKGCTEAAPESRDYVELFAAFIQWRRGREVDAAASLAKLLDPRAQYVRASVRVRAAKIFLMVLVQRAACFGERGLLKLRLTLPDWDQHLEVGRSLLEASDIEVDIRITGLATLAVLYTYTNRLSEAQSIFRYECQRGVDLQVWPAVYELLLLVEMHAPSLGSELNALASTRLKEMGIGRLEDTVTQTALIARGKKRLAASMYAKGHRVPYWFLEVFLPIPAAWVYDLRYYVDYLPSVIHKDKRLVFSIPLVNNVLGLFAKPRSP